MIIDSPPFTGAIARQDGSGQLEPSELVDGHLD